MNNKFDALKDDDSGDHDQNEENSTQKDGEKEKMERDRSQSSSKRKVEQFWRFYSHMVRPGDLTGHSDFHLFKEGIKPMWEDDANKNGGKWIIRLRKGLASRCWENLILAMLGEQFMVGEEICGAVVSVRFQEDIISIWNKTASDQATTARIRDTLRRVLNLPPNTIMEYKTHTDSIKKAGPEPPAATRLLQPVIVRSLLPTLIALCFSLYQTLWKNSAGFSWLCYSVPPHFHFTNKP
ncbi:eukaryotic translation initiation factor 4E type 2 isoform X4 [Delphinapterus leucas]|uniref:Eukaryotic translation initiation factor 4E type 2 isoform X4 n=1 Tax=Delphinapterus leucas TaxID=9749 RepID=A0A2Y9MRY8_DELLE|nr:eukaryotic translation initiation factor 4E type 2 isoform X4 [Delphinapterus leucas]